MRLTTDRGQAVRHRRSAALVALALVAALAVPTFQSPATAAPGEVDVSIDLVTPPPPGPLAVGRPFSFVVEPVIDDGGFPIYFPTTTITYDVPEEFRIDRAEAISGNDYICDVVGQQIRCDWNAGGTVGPQVRISLTPIATGADVESTLTVSVDQPEVSPDPTPNDVSFVRDVVGSTVDAGAYAYALPEDAQVGGPVTFQTFVYTRGSGQVSQAIDAGLVQEVPAGITIDDVSITRSGFDPWGSPLEPSGSCAAAGQTVTCTGMDLTDEGQFVIIDGTATAAGSFTTTATIATNGVSQTEVSPDPTPNTSTATLEVGATDLPSQVSGAITDATGAAVVGATVAAFEAADGSTPTASTTTGAGGAYTLAALPPGTYQLRLTPPGGSPLAVQWSGARTTRAGSTTTVVTGAGEPITAVDEVLVDTDPTHVDLRAAVFTSPESPLPVDEPVTIYYAVINTPRQVDGTSVAAAEDVEAVAVVPAGFAISSVAIADPNRPGQPVTGSCATAGQTVTCTGLDAEVGGTRYVVVEATPSTTGPGLLAELSVTSTSQDEVVVDPNPNSRVVPVPVSDGTDPSVVSGTVVDLWGKAVAGVDVWAYAPSDGFVPPAGARTVTDGLGRFELPALAPGSYAIRYGPPAGSGLVAQWQGAQPTRGTAVPVEVAGLGAPVEVSDILAYPVASALGAVLGPGGAPLAGVTVQAFQPGVSYFPAASAVTDANGRYELSGMGRGSYELVFRAPAGSGLADEWFDGSATRAGADAVPVFGTSVGLATVTLEAAGSLSGSVTGPSGAPLGGARVVAFGPGDTWAGSYEAVTAGDGSFTVPALPASSYAVRFVPPSGSGLVPQWFDGVSSRGAATPVVVTSGGSATGIDASWAP